MAKYGFDRNEIISTKTTIIDKDGFIFETDKYYSEDPSDYDVIFIDYDGTVPYTYMAEDFLAMKTFPPDPQHEGLISRGWNWDFDEAQEYVRKYGALVIGETYSPADGATQITINLTDRLHLPICFQQSISNGVEIDWGDKSRYEYVSGTGVVTASHDYPKAGEYVLRLKAKAGCELGFGDPENRKSFFDGYYGENMNSTSGAIVKKLILSDSVKTFWQYAFFVISNCECISLSNSIETITNDNVSSGISSYKLKTLIFPKNVTSISGMGGISTVEYVSFSNSVEECPGWFMMSLYSLKVLTLPTKMTAISYDEFGGNVMPSFSAIYNLRTLVLPDSIVSIPNSCFSNGYHLERIYISNNLETIGNSCFGNLFSLKTLHLPNNLRTIGENCFDKPNPLETLVLPETLESIGNNSFRNVSRLKELSIPDNCVTIGQSVFNTADMIKTLKLSESAQTVPKILSCAVLETVTIPECVTTIPAMFMNNALVLHDAIFKPTVPPTIQNNTMFTYAPKDLRIWVPYSADHSILNAYKAASSWAKYASMVHELNEDGTIPEI